MRTISRPTFPGDRGGRPGGGLSDTGITNLNTENFNVYKPRINAALMRGFGSMGDRLAITLRGTRPNAR